MAKTMTPSKSLTDGQVDKAVSIYRAMLEKHRAELGSDEAQLVLGDPGYVNAQLAVLRARVEAFNDVIVCRVKVNRNRTPQEALDATGREQYTDFHVVDGMPRGTEEEVDVCFFPLKKFTNVADVQKALEDRGLKPDPMAQAAVNEQDAAFADSHPNGTQWVDGSGSTCCLAFARWRGERGVSCRRPGDDWGARWWVGGVRK